MKNKGRQQKKGIGRFENEKLYRTERLRLQNYRGVYFNNSSKEYPFRAQIQHKNVKYHLGKFKTIEEASLAYNQSAIELFGTDAVLNKYRNTTVYINFEKSIDDRIKFYKKMIERLENIKENIKVNSEVNCERGEKSMDLKRVKTVEAEMQRRHEALAEKNKKNWMGRVRDPDVIDSMNK